MRIGIYDPYLDDVGGGEKYMMTIAECLSSNHNVEVFWDNLDDFKLTKTRFGLDLSRVRLVPNIFKYGFVKKLIESRKYDVIVFLSDGSIPFLLSRKLFLHVQRPLESSSDMIKTKLKLSRVNKIFCNSKFTKGYIDKNLNVDSIVIYPPVDLKPKKIKKENIILHVGRFRIVDKTVGGARDYKKQYIMIDAFKKVHKEIPATWKFVMAVSVKDRDQEEFDRLIEKTKGYPIEFVVNRTNEELWELYSRAKIYWHASGYDEDLDSHPEFAEHFGISTVEAMGGGAVPVVINAGGQREIVEDNVSGLLWNTLSEFERKTIMLIKDKRFFERLAFRAKKRASDFSKDKFYHEIKKLIEN